MTKIVDLVPRFLSLIMLDGHSARSEVATSSATPVNGEQRVRLNLPELPIIDTAVVEGQNGSMNLIYAAVSQHGSKGCTGCKTSKYNGGVPSCHDSAVGEYNDSGELIREGCGYICCQIDPQGQGNTIYLFGKDELESGKNTDHLTVLKTEDGIPYVECTTGICDGDVDVKPLDCKLYPFLPVIQGDLMTFQHGKRSKCPMPETDRMLHLAYTVKAVLQRLKMDPEGTRHVLEVAHTHMVNYEPYDASFLEDLTPEEMLEYSDATIAGAYVREKKRIKANPPEGSTPEERTALALKFKEDMEAMRDMNMRHFEELRAAGVVFGENGIDLSAIDLNKIN